MEDIELKKPWGIKLNTYNMLMHVSQLSGFIAFGVGFIVPLVMWLSNKDEYEEVDRHGKIVVNWMLSSLIYIAIAFIFVFAFVGIIALIVIPILCTVFTIVGAVKASEGEYWDYPMTIKFFK